ncbi:SdiA-regulated domain-containing protein [Cochleicola gelatinilyticus]|uniref:SdiA-regulated family protein n=1 Tax=Cochleicola gelatinilyticus TaxID=1763537 RepID=A0A167HIJ7_9FLAO|nr:SdiA-regulated domain-containing protein [Cochleicola gelatinilyticus]OAB78649.1 hypothetical protein ULVI_08685 [Cochleicola gelatinilyticus]
MKTLNYFLLGLFTVIVVTATLAVTAQPLTNKLQHTHGASEYSVEKTWELPKDLNEVSGIAWISDNTIASVQDEDGVIFIYDLEKKKVVKEIEFAGSGDYEGITVHNDNAYVLRSDGKIYEVVNFLNENKSVTTFETDFSSKNNMETLAFDTANKALLIAPKDRDKKDDFKGLYTIPIESKTMEAVPTIKINMNDIAFKNFKKKKVYKTFSPSDVSIHPKTGEYYVLEGIKPKLVILDADGTIKKVHELDTKEFSQPEGITFSPDGTLYISNESGDGPATIVQVKFNQ